jgi:hypothetical protein
VSGSSTGDFVDVRLFEETADVALRVGLDQAVRAWILHRRQHDRRLGLAFPVQRDDRREVDLGQHVAVEDDHRLAQRFARVAHGAGRAERRRLDDVADAEAAVAAVAKDLFDPSRLIVEAQDRLIDLRHLLQQIELIVEKRPIEDRNDRFWCVNRQRTEPRTLAPREQNRLHANHRCYHVNTGRS